jgi:hypothetical protein
MMRTTTSGVVEAAATPARADHDENFLVRSGRCVATKRAEEHQPSLFSSTTPRSLLDTRVLQCACESSSPHSWCNPCSCRGGSGGVVVGILARVSNADCHRSTHRFPELSSSSRARTVTAAARGARRPRANSHGHHPNARIRSDLRSRFSTSPLHAGWVQPSKQSSGVSP